jgi:BlaI family transcriptional regulator, penicillinase repressor
MGRLTISKLELGILEALWNNGPSSIRDIRERLPEKRRPAYTTVQTMVYRLEKKRAVKRLRKIGNAHIFEAAVSRESTHGALVEHLLGFFGGRVRPVMAHLVESGRLTIEDVKEAERTLRRLARKDGSS